MAGVAAIVSEAAIKVSLNLPKTTLPMRSGGAIRETRFIERLTSDLYRRQLASRKDAKAFILHDGPPYANGSLHIGHFMNKVLKDIANRHRLQLGERVLFVPGWDCHGLPIELKALQEARAAKLAGDAADARLSPLEIRSLARKVAESSIAGQAADFVKWGIMADWELDARHTRGNVYVTMDPAYEAAQLRVFQSLVSRGAVSRSLRPVHWSPSSRTALAEAELEYAEAHVSTAVHVAFPLHSAHTVADSSLSRALSLLPGGVHAVAWTTTPWTLPANVALCVHPELVYAILRLGMIENGFAGPAHVLIAQARVQAFLAEISKFRGSPVTGEVVLTCTGSQIAGALFQHPVQAPYLTAVPELSVHRADGRHVRLSPLLTGTHVTSDSGTGIVHTAPGHGHDDFNLCALHNEAVATGTAVVPIHLPVLCPIDDDGRFTADASAALNGKSILNEGNTACLDQLHDANALLSQSLYPHRYPYDWRTRKPVVIRVTSQWFVDVGSIIQDTIQAVAAVNFVPHTSRTRLTATVGSRSAWCISRQRSWGVPIPAFFRSDTGEALLTPEIIAHVSGLVEKRGTDVWWLASVDELLPSHVVDAARAGGYTYAKGQDTLDVWFDSGSSWASAWARNPESLERLGLGRQVDMVLEGSDQHRGWFQSSLLTSVAVTGTAPYKRVVSHGFVVAEDGRKMSKSLGNVIAPGDIIHGKPTGGVGSGGKGKWKKDKTDGASSVPPVSPGHGVDVLRYWVASSDYTRDVAIGPGVIDRVSETLKKVRNTLRFLLGALHGYDPIRAHAALTGCESTRTPPAGVDGVDGPLLNAWQTEPSPALNAARLPSLRLLDRGLLHKLSLFDGAVRAGYDDMALENVVYAINGFAARDLSPAYVELAKDRLYQQQWGWNQLHSGIFTLPDRFLVQTVLWEALRTTTKALAPIAPFVAEDVYQHSASLMMDEEAIARAAARQGVEASEALYESSSTVFDSIWHAVPTAWTDPEAGAAWDALFALRGEVNRTLEAARMARDIGAPSEAAVELRVAAGGSLCRMVRLAEAAGQLEDLLGCSAVTLVEVVGSSGIGKARPEAARQVIVTGHGRVHPDVSRLEAKHSGPGIGQGASFEYHGYHTVSVCASDASTAVSPSSVRGDMPNVAGEAEPVHVVARRASGCRCVRCRKYREDVIQSVQGGSGLCDRCAHVMADMKLI